MAVKEGNRRISVTFAEDELRLIKTLADADNVNVSWKVRELVLEMLELFEEKALERVAIEREKSFDRSKALTHNQMLKLIERKR